MSSSVKLTLALAVTLLFSSISVAQYYPAYPNARGGIQVRRDFRAYRDGYRDGYNSGLYRGHGSAPAWMMNGLFGEERKEYKRGYHDGFRRGKNDRRYGTRPRIN